VAATAGIGHPGDTRLPAHLPFLALRGWTPVAVQQKMMRHADIRTTFNIYGDVVTNEMNIAGLRLSELALWEMER
jgi:integrase